MLIAFFEDYLDCVSDLISHEMIWSMDKLQHHAGVSCLDHSFNVSYSSYAICKKFNLDYRSAARGGLLHDFFLYDWHDSKKGTMHGIRHPKIALENANKFFHLNKTEKEIIQKHMWPLTIIPSVHKEAYVVMLVDKYCTLMEFFRFNKQKFLR